MLPRSKDSFLDIIKALGLVFGDIGTSPIYTFTVIFTFLPPTQENILGIISLIIWTLIILVTLGYAVLAMSLDIHGEGGTLILRRILDDFLKSKKSKAFFTVLAFIGVSLLLGEGVITPSISILSAVEGIALIPGFESTEQWILILTAMIITFFLFIFQPKGTDNVASKFGPIMVIWLIALASFGGIAITKMPVALKAINPVYALSFLQHHGIAGFFILSQVILCATGVEALYADMGHLGRKPIVRAWDFAFVALAINYIGQGAFLLAFPDSKNILFAMAKNIAPSLYIPFLFLTIAATIIASQALISGVFSVVYQGINTGVFPRLKVEFTSQKLKSQIYIPSVNWALMMAVFLILIVFKESGKLAVAYGLSVTGAMCVTATIMSTIFLLRCQYLRFSAAVCIFFIDLAYFLSNLIKLKEGAYWSIIIASVPFTMMMLWTRGHKKVYTNLRSLDLETFLPGYTQIYAKGKNIPGTAIFFVSDINSISPYIIHCVAKSGIIYERNVLLSVSRTDFPYGIETRYNESLGAGLQSLELHAGYKEDIDIEAIIKSLSLDPKVIFYGLEDIYTSNFAWKIFALIKKLSPSFVKYYKIPGGKLHGVMARVEI